MTATTPLSDAAIAACKKYPDSDVELAMDFAAQCMPTFVGADNDRLQKAGRAVKGLVDIKDDEGFAGNLETSLALVVQECELLMSGKIKVPKVTFGKTGLQMSVVTLGCMRFQEEWGPHVTNMNQVGSDCQDNLVRILKRALLEYGINHIETARGYGSSELQLGVALKQLMQTGQIKRQDFLLQTKVNAVEDTTVFRANLEKSFQNLQLEYIDLFAFHGINLPEQLKWIVGDGTEGVETCYSVVQQYVKAGKIRHVGFSTHASTDLILECIKTDLFEYANIHYHFLGSYTASGGGHDGEGNRDCAKLMNQKNMGCFIISPFDKGGALFVPSRKLRRLTLPEFEPMAFECFRIWNHHHLVPNVHLHTFTNGAGRPSDLDQPCAAAYLQSIQPDVQADKVKRVAQRLLDEREKVLGKEWVDTWWKGLTKANDNKNLVEHNQIVWFYNCLKAYGLYNFTKARYHSFEANAAKWDEKLSDKENIYKNLMGWGYVPGLPLKEDADYSEDLAQVPPENLERVKEAHAFVYKWLAIKNKKTTAGEAAGAQLEDNSRKLEELKIPQDWEDSFDQRTWVDFPDRRKREY